MNMDVRTIDYRAFSDIEIPDDVEPDSEDARLLAESYRVVGGHIHDPIARLKDGVERLLVGRRRVAAHMLRGEEGCTMKVIECSDWEAEVIREVENAYREHAPGKQATAMKRLVAMFEAKELAAAEEQKRLEEQTGEKPKRPRGRPKSAKSKARDRAASLLGVKPDSVRRALHRSEQAQQEASPIPAKKPIKTLGMGTGQPFLDEVASIQELTGDVAKRVSLAQRFLTQLERSSFDFPSEVVDDVRQALDRAGQRIKRARPESLCPYCKGVPGVQEACGVCEGRGWVGQLDSVPVDLLDDVDPQIYVHGELWSVRDYLESQQPADKAPEASAEPDDSPPLEEPDPWGAGEEPEVIYEEGEYQDYDDTDEPPTEIDPWTS